MGEAEKGGATVWGRGLEGGRGQVGVSASLGCGGDWVNGGRGMRVGGSERGGFGDIWGHLVSFWGAVRFLRGSAGHVAAFPL